MSKMVKFYVVYKTQVSDPQKQTKVFPELMM